MKTGRRRFLQVAALGAGAAAGGAVAWVGGSSSRRARFFRELVRDATRRIAPPAARPTPAAWSDQALTVAWLGHATLLLNLHGFTVLTDPVFGDRVGVGAGGLTLGPKRYVAPALPFEALPRIDLILISHAHMDHFDLATLRRFGPGPRIVTARDTGDLLAGMACRDVTELGWGDRATVASDRGPLHLEAFEVKHWGQRWPSEKPRGYNGYVLTREGRRVLFAGDTAFTERIGALRSRGPFDVALMPIGAYHPWIRNHCTPEQAVAMADRAGARQIVPFHHLTFKLSDEPMTEPLARLEAALAREPDRLALRRVGETARVA